MLMMLPVSLTSCATSSPPVVIKGVDYDDLKNGSPQKSDDKMWVTYEYAKRYLHWKNHK